MPKYLKQTIIGHETWEETITMKKWMITVLCAGLASLAQAADAPVVVSPASPPIGGVVGQPCCSASCVAKVCAPVPAIKKTEKVIYDEKCVDYCIPRCSLLSIFRGQCGCGNECSNCGQPRTKHLLVKKIAHEECPDVKCEVQAIPCAGLASPCGTAPK